MPTLINQVIVATQDHDVEVSTVNSGKPKKEWIVIYHDACDLSENPQVFFDGVEITFCNPGGGCEYEIYRISATQSVIHVNRQALPIGQAVVGNDLIVK